MALTWSVYFTVTSNVIICHDAGLLVTCLVNVDSEYCRAFRVSAVKALFSFG